MTRIARLAGYASLLCFLGAWGLFSYALVVRVTMLLAPMLVPRMPTGLGGAVEYLLVGGSPSFLVALVLYTSALLLPGWALVGLLRGIQTILAWRAAAHVLTRLDEGD